MVVTYDGEQRAAYEAGRASEFDPWGWPTDLRIGRNKKGCFPEVVVRAHFERKGYNVLVSEPQFPGASASSCFTMPVCGGTATPHSYGCRTASLAWIWPRWQKPLTRRRLPAG